MKRILSFFLAISLLSASSGNLYSQECEVGVETLKGKYDGECKSGKANGKGKATGTDTYEGEFKSGLPHGKGIYTWANGDWFEGWWQKGKKDGNGTIHYKMINGDSAINGFWKKDEYIGLYEKPYEIITKGIEGTVDVRHNKNDSRNEITINVSQVQNRLTAVVQPVLTFVNVSTGFYTGNTETKTNNKNIYSLKQVSFPFRATFTFGMREVEIEFFVAGFYTVTIAYNN